MYTVQLVLDFNAVVLSMYYIMAVSESSCIHNIIYNNLWLSVSDISYCYTVY